MTTTTKKKTTKKDSLELPLKPFAFEVLHLASKQRLKAKKVEVLKKYEASITESTVSYGILTRLLYPFYQRVKFLIRDMMNKLHIVVH